MEEQTKGWSRELERKKIPRYVGKNLEAHHYHERNKTWG